MYLEHIKLNKSLYINSNCLLVMQQMINKNIKVNCILVDPPYGINHHSNRRKDKSDMTTRGGILNDENNEELLEKSLELSYQCLEDNSHIYWFTKWTEIDKQMPMLKKYYNIKNIIIWDKGNHGSGDLTGAYGNRYECISKVPAQKLIHPHQKPVELLEFLILKSTNEGEKILDMFTGVGSTLVAAIKNNRDCIAIELDKDVYDKGKSRLTTDEVQQYLHNAV